MSSRRRQIKMHYQKYTLMLKVDCLKKKAVVGFGLMVCAKKRRRKVLCCSSKGRQEKKARTKNVIM